MEEDDQESFGRRENLEVIMEIGMHENMSENNDDDMVSQINGTGDIEENLLFHQ